MDVIELGRPDRVPRGGARSPRRGWPLGVVAIVLLAAVGYAATRSDEPAPRAEPSPSPVVVVPPLETVPVTDPSTEPTEEPPPPDPNLGEWQLPALRVRTGLAFVSADWALSVMDVDTGRITQTPVGEDGEHGDYVEPVGRIDGGWLVVRRSPCGDFPCAPASVYAVRGTRVTLVATGHTATLDPDGRSVWVTGFPPNATNPETPEWLERRTFDGTRVGPRTTLRRHESVIGVTPRGPLVGAFQGDHAYLLDRVTRARREVVTGRSAVAVSGHEVVTMTDGCSYGPGTCLVAVENVATGRVRTVGRLYERPNQLALDPTGRYLAVSFETGRTSVRVYDVNTGRDLFVEGLTFPPLASGLAWSPDGRWLVLAVPRVGDDGNNADNGTRVAVWRPGFNTAYAAPVYEGVFATRSIVAAARVS